MSAAALSTDSNDSLSLQNGQVSSTDEDGVVGVVQAGTKREAPVDDDTNDGGDDSLPASDEPSVKKVKLVEEESNSETPEQPAAAAVETTPVESTNGDGH